ncbi:MAG: cytochrome c biogenesis protein ResB [Planctomycetes bacterium]|nr:cytochrome c biogenesis protein ResB [Planctomycetota bacterium]
MNIRLKIDPATAVRIRSSVLGVFVVTSALVAAGQAWSAARGTALASPGAIVAAGLLALGAAAVFRRPLYAWLVSLPFSVGLLGAILFATALGTVIVQGAPPEAFTAKYGTFLAGAFRAVGLEDVFHSFAFRGLMALLALSLALVVVDRRGWRRSEWCFSLNHAGIIVILAGGLVGSFSGMKGFIDIHQGQVARSFVLRDRFDRPTSQSIPLGFGLRLDKFEIERLPPEFRLYVYRKDGSGFKPASSRGMAEATAWTEAGEAGRSYRLIAAYPDFEMTTEVRDAPEGTGAPCLQLKAVDRDGNIHSFTLVAGEAGRDAAFFPESRTVLRFAWEESAIRISAETAPERHIVMFRRAGTKGAFEEAAMTPGEGRASLGGSDVAVLAWYPDFAYDSATKTGSSRSPEPRNPAVRVSIQPAGGPAVEDYLFANNPGYGDADGTTIGDLQLRYRYEPGRKPADRDVVVVGATEEVLDFRHGVLKERGALPAKRTDKIARGVNATVVRMSACAEEVHVPVTRSRKWRNPVAEIEMRASGKVEKKFLKAGMPLDLGDGRNSLVFQPKPDDVKSYRSQVSVIFEGEPVSKETISVNHPLSFGGYRFYQSSFRREDPSYSGILVVKDPGLPLAYAGFVMICLGAIGRFYLQPWLQKRRQRQVA